MGKSLGLRVVLAMATRLVVRSPIDVLNRTRKQEEGSLVAVSNDSYLCTSGDLEV